MSANQDGKDASPHDARKRQLIVLAAATVVAIALAAMGAWHQANEAAKAPQPREFLQGFALRLNDAARIRIGSKDHGSFDIVLSGGKWVLPALANYPASFEEVRKTLVGMAGLETIEPKTGRADWLSYVDLDAPPKGKGVSVMVFDQGGRNLAGFIAGKNEDIGDTSGAMGLFVRKSGESQSWLVRSIFIPKSDPLSWTSKTVADISASRIRRIDVVPATGRGFSLAREKPEDGLSLAQPGGRPILNSAASNGLAASLAGFSFDDVKPAAALDFSKASQVSFITFDGVQITAKLLKNGPESWVSLSASILPQSGAAAEAAAINAHAAGWAYKLAPYKAAQFGPSLETLLQAATASAGEESPGTLATP